MAWYRTGRVAVTLNSATVTGAGTDFVSNARVGDAFIGPSGAIHEVTNIASANVISITPVYGGATASNATYTIAPVLGYVKQLADQAAQILSQWGTTLAGLGPVANQSVVPLTMGGTGATTDAAARTALGLGGAATRSVGTAAGNLLERGAFGLGTTYAQGLTFVASMSAADSLGFYGYSATTAGVPNFGSGYGGFLNMPVTADGSGSYGAQLAIDYNTAAVGVRRIAAGAWSTWAKLYHTGNTTVAADGTLKAI